DVGHELANSKGDTQKVISFARRFSKNIVHMHFSDNDGKADSHMAIGEGKMDWKKLIPALKSIYDGPITLEIADTAGAMKNKAANGKSVVKNGKKKTSDASEQEYRKAVFASKVSVEKGWYGKKKTLDDYDYIYPKGKKPVLKV
ncbi:MAG TPA: TIM barrel protein, partial [Candidatus Micrarchaeota archaeon]|nr:TIM barrel protein [Candidatus Micrarchaeota archaeon]